MGPEVNFGIGIDCEEKMITLASKRFLDTSFYTKNILEDELPIADYYICSGAMNILEEEEAFIFINKCFKASKKAFVFNLLKNDQLSKLNINDIYTYCKSLSKQTEVRENYLDNDISILMEK